jgi:hypothetical protein
MIISTGRPIVLIADRNRVPRPMGPLEIFSTQSSRGL